MMYYKNGVFHDEACTNRIDHAVVSDEIKSVKGC
jgi:hypothetical protein